MKIIINILNHYKKLFEKKGFIFIIKYFILNFNSNKFLNSLLLFDKISYSQNGEDLFIRRKLKNIKKGFYLDIGANNPEYINNTKKFYDLGWSGINIEPNPELIDKFNEKRIRDINLNIGIGDKNSDLIFYKCSNDVVSTFSTKIGEKLIKEGEKVEKIIVKVKKLDYILKENKVNKIDFLTLDTEGFNEIILNSINWSAFRPTLICIEDEEGYGDYYDTFFKKIGYKKIGLNITNLFFINTKG